MTDTNFQPIFDYIDKSLEPVLEKLDNIENRLSNQETAIANLASQVKTYHEEMLAANHRMDRIESMVKYIAQQTNVKLPY